MKNKLNILIIIALQILFAQAPVFKSPYLTDDMRNSTKTLLKFDEVAKTIKDSDRIEKLKKQVKFYRAVSEAIYIEYNKLNDKNIEKIKKFESLINQYIEVVGTNVNDIALIDPPEITYEYKPMKITSTAVKKQNHKKQAKLMKKNYILMFKYYKETSSIYTSYLQYLKELKESGQYKIKENLISDSVQPDSNVSEASMESEKEDQVVVESRISDNIIDEPISTPSSDPQASQVNSEELEKINEELTYRIQSLEVRIDEIEEEENKKSNGISKQVKNIEKKIETLEENDKSVQVAIEVIKEENNDYSKRDYPQAFIDAKNNGITQFTYRGKTIYAFTRKEYRNAMSDARIYGKENFEIGNQIFDSKLEYEQIKRLSQ